MKQQKIVVTTERVLIVTEAEFQLLCDIVKHTELKALNGDTIFRGRGLTALDKSLRGIKEMPCAEKSS